ncbi:hypothetical protein [Streptomyces sp. NPDC001851]|uniref:hypothetical protein n=1 Tax=Streptomyces sp. NPDC001851 TaxID=3154529 RepID=UPI003321D1CD
MSIHGFGGLSALEVHPLQTVLCGSGSHRKNTIALAGLLACVVNGDTMTSVLHAAAWLVVAITILVLVQLVAARLPAGRRELKRPKERSRTAE